MDGERSVILHAIHGMCLCIPWFLVGADGDKVDGSFGVVILKRRNIL
jgi:hypothetical protein